MASGSPSPRIGQIWRYPVKSLRGEQLDRSVVTERGLLGDRLWAVVDTVSGGIGSGKDTRRFRRFPGPPLLWFSARYPAEPAADAPVSPPVVVGRDGAEHPVASGEAQALFRRESGLETLTVAREAAVDHFDEGPVSVISEATLRWVSEQVASRSDARRFRPNLVVTGLAPFEEEAWCGGRIRIGNGHDAVELAVDHVLERCVMVNTEQADLPQAPEVLKLLGRRADRPVRLAVVAFVAKPGVVRVGDPVTRTP